MRRSSLFSFPSYSTLRIGTSDHPGKLLYVSPIGAQFIADQTLDLRIGQECKLKVFSSDRSAYVEVESWIVDIWKADIPDPLVGVEFFNVSDALKQELYRMANYYPGTSRPLDREVPVFLGDVAQKHSDPQRITV